MPQSARALVVLPFLGLLLAAPAFLRGDGASEALFPAPIRLDVPPVSTHSAVKLDYDIVYVRAPRKGDNARSYWAEIAHPATVDAGADLVLLHPDGSEEVIVPAGPDG